MRRSAAVSKEYSSEGIPSDLKWHPEGDEEPDAAEEGSMNIDVSRLPKNVAPHAREILSRMYGVPLDITEKGVNNEVKVEANQEVHVTNETKQSKRPNPCSADYADEYLQARLYETPEGLRLWNHRGQWLRFNGTCYEPLSDKELRADVINYFTGTPLRGRVRKAFAAEIIGHLEARCLMPDTVSLPAFTTEGKWYEEPGTITLQNGVIDLSSVRIGVTPELQAHKSKLISTTRLPYDYNPKAECPLWMAFLEQVLPDQGSRRLLQQMFGYCLTPDMSLQKFFMFEGTGGNGKSIATSILRRLVGINNTSSLPLKCFHDKHGLISTYGKLVNFAGELKEKDAVAEDLLKQATGGDLMHFEAKYQKAFSAPFTAKIVISTNERPAFTDRSNGLWRRLIIVPFPVLILPEKQDPGLEEKLATELSGILNWAIRGAIDLNTAGRFEEPQVSREALASFKEQANPEQVFFKECCQFGADMSAGTQEFYESYRRYAERTGHKPLNGTKFQAEVVKLPGVKKERPHTNGPRHNIYRGITVYGLNSPPPQGDHQQPGGLSLN
jgi:putative DNA primase/helicase